MEKLNITSTLLDKLGFSEYDDENGDWGGRHISFENGERIRIMEMMEKDDEHDGYGSMMNAKPTYQTHHFCFSDSFAYDYKERPFKKSNYDLFFLHELYNLIEIEYPKCLEEFRMRCFEVNMESYLPPV